MKEKISEIKASAIKAINEAKNMQSLNDLRVAYLGKKGKLTEILRGMGGLLPEERPVIGNLINKVKSEVESIIKEKEDKFKEEELNLKLEKEKIDVTLPASKIIRGSKQPLNRVIE